MSTVLLTLLTEGQTMIAMGGQEMAMHGPKLKYIELPYHFNALNIQKAVIWFISFSTDSLNKVSNYC